MGVELRVAESEMDAVLVFKAFMSMHDEGGTPGAFHPVKTLSGVLRLIREPGGCILMAMDGDELAGVLALYEQAYWWSLDTHLTDKGFYVLPQHRAGGASNLLLDAAARTADDLGIPVFISIFNGRRKRGGRSKWERVGATLGYGNLGAVIAHFPET